MTAPKDRKTRSPLLLGALAASLIAHGIVLALTIALWPAAPGDRGSRPARSPVDVSLGAATPVAGPVRPVAAAPAQEPEPLPSAVAAPVSPRARSAPARGPEDPRPEAAPRPGPIADRCPGPPPAPAPAPPPPPPPRLPARPAPAAPSPTVVARAYLAQLREHLEAARTYPPLARRNRVEGVVRLGFEVEAGGRIQGVRVLESSGARILDEAAAAALRAVSGRLPLPPALAGVTLRSSVRLTFRLDPP